MAMQPCRECGQSVSTEAKSCPHCGVAKPAPRSRNYSVLGFYAALAVGVALLLSVRSCYEQLSADRASRTMMESTRAKARRADTLSLPVAAQYDGDVHRDYPSLPHDTLHNRAAVYRLDEVDRDLAKGSMADAATHIQSVTEPLSDSLRVRYKALQQRVAPFIAKQNQHLADAAKAQMIQGRKLFAKQLEQNALDSRMDATVTTFGPDATGLRMKWILVSRVTANDFSKTEGFFEKLRTYGFKRFEITDGYRENWYWDLK
jgi:hypothetical protein